MVVGVVVVGVVVSRSSSSSSSTRHASTQSTAIWVASSSASVSRHCHHRHHRHRHRLMYLQESQRCRRRWCRRRRPQLSSSHWCSLHTHTPHTPHTYGHTSEQTHRYAQHSGCEYTDMRQSDTMSDSGQGWTARRSRRSQNVKDEASFCYSEPAPIEPARTPAAPKHTATLGAVSSSLRALSSLRLQ